MGDVTEEIRSACDWVAARARHVQIDHGVIAAYAASLPPVSTPSAERTSPGSAEREQLTAFWLTLDAVNFGSGWFPTLRKPPGRSGYHTIAEAIRERFERQGAWTADQLTRVNPAEIAAVLGQDSGHELMALFACSLRDLGEHLNTNHGGRFAAPIDYTDTSAVKLVELLAGWSCFADTSSYEGRPIPFLKRAQIAAADLHRVGAATFGDLGRLTMFADNLVPHVLRLDGALRFAPSLVERIDRHSLIEHGSPEEVEIRACSVHAVELIVDARPGTYAAAVDQLLWERGSGARYKASPRHRCRCTAY
ncbi:MAG TPA: queuosine salvage family protein [Solirubrobacteraceae bacterium]